ncbi:hypothetical protein V8E54_006052 [Elaphomyces granulatus]
MRYSAKAAAFLIANTLFSPLLASAHDQHCTAASVDNSPVLLWRNSNGVFVRFNTPCLGCWRWGNDGDSDNDGNDGLPLEFNAFSAKVACGESEVSLNGQRLTHTWNGSLGHGSGVIPGTLFRNERGPDMSASWSSLCIPGPAGAPGEQAAQILSLQIDRIRDVDLSNSIGFTISFRQLETPEVLRLSPHPLNIPKDIKLLEPWRDPPRSERLENNPNVAVLGQDPKATQIEQELTKLQRLCVQAESIKSKAQKVHGLLVQNCKALFSKWKQCPDIKCIINVTFQAVPEFFRSLKYQLSLSKYPKFVPTCGQHRTDPTTGSNLDFMSPSPPPSFETNENSTKNYPNDTETVNSFSSHPDLPAESSNYFDVSSLSPALPFDHKIIRFARTCLILLLIASVAALICKVTRSSSACRRRRVDLAARREERRARRAYRLAARRLRWRQWWEGRSYRPTPVVSSDHHLSQLDAAESGRGQNPNSDQEPEQAAMRAEILGFRRVLEYVGELVRNNDDRAQRPPEYETVGDPARTGHNGASSTALGLTTINSPRTSSLTSLDTASSLTLETLDTSSEPGPPAYHR